MKPTRPIRIGRFGLLENPVGLQVTWKQHIAGCGREPRTMLADVTGFYYREFPAAWMLKVRHFNGDPIPDVAVGAVRVLDREYEEVKP